MPRLLAVSAGLALPLRPGRRVVGRAVHRLRQWPVESQHAARRNAMLACTTLAARRAEREDVDEFVSRVVGARAAAHG